MANKNEAVAQKHKAAITQSAMELFAQKGYEKVTMDDVAKQGDYSKRTVYEYFSSKDEIYFSSVLCSFECLRDTVEKVCSMRYIDLSQYISADVVVDINAQSLGEQLPKIAIKQQFFELCFALADLYEKNPLSFEAVTQFSSLPQIGSPHYAILLAIYEVGEHINSILTIFLHRMIEAGIVKKDLLLIPSIFMLWSSLSGIIKMAQAKQAYLVQATGMTRDAFMRYAFELLYCSIAVS